MSDLECYGLNIYTGTLLVPEQALLLSEYVPEPVYPEYLVLSNDDIPVEYQPLPADASPTALSPGYIADSDSKEDLEKDTEDDPKEDLVDYPADEGDGEEEEESSEDDADDEDEDEASEEEDDDEEEEDERLAPADSSIVPIDDPVPSAEDTEAFETYESAPTCYTPEIDMKDGRLVPGQMPNLFALPTSHNAWPFMMKFTLVVEK
uniref:Uncharacterized protein n=1 Tax=Tanacetum cinerariifolium TaxID=118510 RepID=A0A6L2MLK5_TANCI|nr:hypothetical protein [Tanacetum cinerariifolium]